MPAGKKTSLLNDVKNHQVLIPFIASIPVNIFLLHAFRNSVSAIRNSRAKIAHVAAHATDRIAAWHHDESDCDERQRENNFFHDLCSCQIMIEPSMNIFQKIFFEK